MNSRQKIVQQQYIDNEKAVLNRLKQVYGKALDDINKNIEDLMSRTDSDTASVVYRVEYQKALKNQISGILDELNSNQFNTVSEYLATCYDDGYIGTMYDLHGQGIPIITPINQENVVRAVQLDSKISNGLYSRMGEDVSMLKKHITAQVSRGIANGSSFAQVAQQISFKMTGTYNTNGGALGNAMRIARTEGHRIQVQGAMDACYNAKEKGADIVKQWDSTLDARTRDSHAQVDGEIRELDEKFSNGLMYPADPSGGAAEVVNCRCALLQRAKWALDEKELDVLKNRAAAFGLDKTDNFNDFKAKYMKATQKPVKTESKTAKFTPAKTKTEAEQFAKSLGVDADYSKYNIDVANAVNESMCKVRNVFGEDALNNLNRIGTFPKGYSTRHSGGYVKSTDPDFDGSLWLRNVSRKDALEHMGKISKEQYEMGYWSSPNAMGVINHELGHAIHRALGTPEINAELNALRKSIVDERLQRHRKGDHNHTYSDWLSEYGFTNTSEFVAESISEYFDGNPRETALKVVEILLGGAKK